MKKAVDVSLKIISLFLFLIGIATAILGNLSIWFSIAEIIIGIIILFYSSFLSEKKGKRIACIIFATIFAFVGSASVILGTSSFTKPIADIERKLDIWGKEIPGNSSNSKLDYMNINKDGRLLGLSIKFNQSISGENYSDVERVVDTYTYLQCLKTGFEKDTFEDVPFLIPYIVEGSDSAVIIVPGGGYAYKSIQRRTDEGRDVAVALNKEGISAFVLSYRSNPYEMPIPQLDLQRAVKFVRYHANDFGINPEKISLIGFSAGGYQVGSFINQYKGRDNLPNDYTKDEIDNINDDVLVAGMIYPVLTYKFNVGMLFCSFNAEDVRNPQIREDLINKTDLALNFNSADTKQFVCYGTKDRIVNMEGVKNYIKAAKEKGADITEVVATGQNHSFKPHFYFSNFVSLLMQAD